MKNVKQGESYSYAIYLPNVPDLTGYTCTVQLRDKAGTLIDQLTPTAIANAQHGEVFPVQLRSSVSSNLTVGEVYALGAEVNNASTDFSKEVCRDIKITEQCVY